MTTNTPPVDPGIDDLPDFSGFFKFVGITFISVGLFSLLGCFSFSKGHRIGWIMISFVYLGGSVLTAYFLLFSLIKFPLLALMSPMFLVYIFLLLLGIYMLYIIIFKANFLLN